MKFLHCAYCDQQEHMKEHIFCRSCYLACGGYYRLKPPKQTAS